MKIIKNYKNNYARNRFTQKQNVKFKAIPQIIKPIVKKITPGFLASLLIIASSLSCKKQESINQIDNYKGIKIEYQNVKQNIRDSVILPLYKLKDKLTENNDFLDGLKIDIVKYFSTIDNNDAFSNHLKKNVKGSFVKGMSFYSDSKLPRQVAIQESAHKNNSKSKKTQVESMQYSLMHEIGHQFDNYFGHDHNADFALKWDSLQYSKINSTKYTPYNFPSTTQEEKNIDKIYSSNSGLSDKKDFQEAYLKDLILIKNIMQKKSDSLPANIDYYIKKINFNEKITPEVVINADSNRAEVYANMFSYALGNDQGDRENYIKIFPNCYEIVKKDIAKYLNIQK